jgi:hypothetical protein
MNNRIFKAYFNNFNDANRAIYALENVFDCFGPQYVIPQQNRPVLVIIEMPEELSPQIQYLPANLITQIQGVVYKYDGVIVSKPLDPLSQISQIEES